MTDRVAAAPSRISKASSGRWTIGGGGTFPFLAGLAVCTTLPILGFVKLPDAVLFASDAEVALFTGVAVLALAALTNLAERRRVRRARIDQVGWVPWTGLFLVLMVVGVTLVVLGAIGLLKG